MFPPHSAALVVSQSIDEEMSGESFISMEDDHSKSKS